MLVEPTHIDQLLHPQFKDEAAYKSDVIGVGLPASPGAAVGQAGSDRHALPSQLHPSWYLRVHRFRTPWTTSQGTRGQAREENAVGMYGYTGTL
jgi:hypothetical protein